MDCWQPRPNPDSKSLSVASFGPSRPRFISASTAARRQQRLRRQRQQPKWQHHRLPRAAARVTSEKPCWPGRPWPRIRCPCPCPDNAAAATAPAPSWTRLGCRRCVCLWLWAPSTGRYCVCKVRYSTTCSNGWPSGCWLTRLVNQEGSNRYKATCFDYPTISTCREIREKAGKSVAPPPSSISQAATPTTRRHWRTAEFGTEQQAFLTPSCVLKPYTFLSNACAVP